MFPFFQSGADIQLLHSRSPLSDLFKKKETAGHQKIVKKESTMEPKYLESRIKVLAFLSYLQTDEHFIFLNLKIWILVTENCLEIENVLKFESLEACEGNKSTFGWLGQH